MNEEQNMIDEEKEFRFAYACVDAEYYRLRKWKQTIPYYNFFTYVPKSISEQVYPSTELVRKLIWNFKDGVNKNNYVENIVITKLKSVFPYWRKKFTLVCIPASTEEKTMGRYLYFIRCVCQETGIQNGFDYVRITREGDAKHLGGENECDYECDETFFKGRNVIIFDDVLTQGHHLKTMKEKLEAAGAEVWAAFFLGKTGSEDQPHPWVIDYWNPQSEKDQTDLKKLDEQ